MDIGNLGKPQDTGRLVLHHPNTDEVLYDDEDNEMYIELYGQDSSKYKQITNAQQNRNLQKMQRNRRGMTAEQMDANAMELLVGCTASWNIQLGGDKPECDEQTVKQVYTDYPWIREQVDSFVHDRSNFFTKS